MLHLEAKALDLFPRDNQYGRDCKAWAKRINYRFENGDTTLLPVQITFSQMALGLIEEKEAK